MEDKYLVAVTDVCFETTEDADYRVWTFDNKQEALDHYNKLVNKVSNIYFAEILA